MLTRELGRGWKGAMMIKVERLEQTDVMFVTTMASVVRYQLQVSSYQHVFQHIQGWNIAHAKRHWPE